MKVNSFLTRAFATVKQQQQQQQQQKQKTIWLLFYGWISTG